VHLPPDPLPSGEAQGRSLLYDSPVSYDTVLTLARLGMLPFLVVLIIATWAWTRRWYGEIAALLAVAFLVSTPVILGHAAVVALDVPVTALIMLSLFLLLRWFEQPTAARAAALGLGAGLAVATKLSAVPFIGIAALALIALRLLSWRARPLQPCLSRRAWTAAMALVLALIVMVGVYGPTLVYLTTPDHAPSRALDFWMGSAGPLHTLAYRWAARVPVPLGVQAVPLNFLGVEWHNEHGHLSFLLGHTGSTGWWYFYPVALSVKTPLVLLLFGLAGLTRLAVRGARAADVYQLAPAACLVSILVFSCAYSHINIGVRHVLIAYPLLAMGAGTAVLAAWQRWPARSVRAVLLALLLWQFGTLVTSYPDYLAFFNPLAGRHPERILVDSDLDWGGQDLRRLEQVLKARHVTQLAIGYRGTADLAREPLPAYSELVPGAPVHGWVAITMLTLQENQAGFAWLRPYTPERVGSSFDLYFIP
jgi:4-amino-4-deoxy-L-arabinose transferase-like glycosyltransferase